MYCGFFGIRNLCLVCSFQDILHIFTAKDEGGVTSLVSAMHGPYPKGRPSRKLPRIGWTPATEFIPKPLLSSYPQMLTVCLCLLGADNRPWTTYMPTWYDLYFWDQFPVLSLQCLSWEKLIFSPKSSVWKPKHCFLYHPLYSPVYLLFPIHTDYCRLRVSLHSWHRLWLLVSLQWSPQIFLSSTFSTTWWAKVKAEIPAVLLGEAPRDPSPFRGSSFTATELQAVCSPWSKVWRPQKVVGQEDRGGKSLGWTTSFPLSWKSHVCQDSGILFTIILLENKV